MAQATQATSRAPLSLLALLAALSGALFSLAHPPVDAGWLAWGALVPFFLALLRAGGLGRAALCGLCFGWPLSALAFRFLDVFGIAAWLAAATIHALFYALCGGLAWAALRGAGPWRAALALVCAWMLADWLRAQGPLGFTWIDLAYTQHAELLVVQAAALGGVYGLSAVLATANAALAVLLGAAWKKERLRCAVGPALCAALLVGATLGYGAYRLAKPPSGPRLRVAAVQCETRFLAPTAFQQVRPYPEVIARYEETIAQSGERGLDFVVWPESAIPADIPGSAHATALLGALCRRWGFALLAGCGHLEPPARTYNACALFDARGEYRGMYCKNRLVIVGEYVPFRKGLAWLWARYPVRPVDVTPGEGYVALVADGFRVGPVICFESIFPGPCRAATRAGADVLVVITNDGWFPREMAAERHAQIAVLRAVENGRPLVRAALTGISEVIDARGRVLARRGVLERGVAAAEVPLERGRTIYSRIGDVVILLSAVGWLALAGVGWCSGRRERGEPRA